MGLSQSEIYFTHRIKLNLVEYWLRARYWWS